MTGQRRRRDPVPPPGVPESHLFPHAYGPTDRDAVKRVLEVRWDEEERATGLAVVQAKPALVDTW